MAVVPNYRILALFLVVFLVVLCSLSTHVTDVPRGQRVVIERGRSEGVLGGAEGRREGSETRELKSAKAVTAPISTRSPAMNHSITDRPNTTAAPKQGAPVKAAETTDRDSGKAAMFALFAQQAPARRQLLSGSLDWLTLYNVLVPEVYCPYLVRVGYEGDGGKWVCNPTAMPADCGIYSLGLNNDPSFDVAIHAASGKKCNVYAYDKDDQNAQTMKTFASINATFKTAKIGSVKNTENHEYRMSDLLAENGHKRMEILKIDIEGGEFAVMPFILENVPACQIFTEIHGTPDTVLKLLRKFSMHGYRLLTHEINGGHHTLSEYSHIHDSCMKQYGAELMASYIGEANSQRAPLSTPSQRKVTPPQTADREDINTMKP